MTRVVVVAIRQRVEELALLELFAKHEAKMREEFADCFPLNIPHIDDLPCDTYHRFHLKDPNLVIAQ
ncbi:hypothetical protein QCA50_018877 [Cerrena zonata]|uniref:Uncharacterized protein n=1 Tax=Cerrena zonata TaxID=2478898 RepID=A0AAW0FIU4_9APHY